MALDSSREGSALDAGRESPALPACASCHAQGTSVQVCADGETPFSEPDSDTASPLEKASSRFGDWQPLTVATVTRREQVLVWVAAWGLTIVLHGVIFWAAGRVMDWMAVDVHIAMDWSNEPLTGFGSMMDIYGIYEEDVDRDAIAAEAFPSIRPDENPFQETSASRPDLIADQIEPPALPEAEPEAPTVAVTPSPKPPVRDLARDEARLAAVRQDLDSMPKLQVLAPGNAKLIVLIRNDRVRGSRFEGSVRRLFTAFPDYQVTLGRADIDPLTDVDVLLIATANPNLYAETFLVVSHRIAPDRLRRAIESSFPTALRWEEHEGRPLAVPDATDGKYHPNSGIYKRAIYLPDDQTVLFLKPEVLPSLSLPHIAAITANESFLESLGSINTSDSASAPTLFFMVQGIRDIQLGANFPAFPPPAAIQASLSATSDNPRVNLEAIFDQKRDATTFAEVWPEMVAAASRLGIPGLGGLLGSLSMTAEDNRILATGELSGAMMSLVLMFAANRLETINR
ncbi:MAG: hypothetical protein FWC40_07045 [Proteobacteria bacterium]|nr:hypothetical protein [Pseudomonadota bacterium]